MKKKLLFLIMCLLAIQVNAQNSQLKGVVEDTTGEPLIGASVVVTGTKTGVVTDIDGSFNLNLPDNAKTISVSYIGFKEQIVNIVGKTDIKIILEEDGQQLGDVVVTALGVKREKKALGYAVHEVSGNVLSTVKSVSPFNALAGSIAGLNVSSAGSGPGGSVRLLLRGANSMTGNNEPLYVIDGIPLDNTLQNQGRAGGGIDYGNAANNINADDIESISVLKGGAAAALYGSRGQNGVVMITTKQGKKGGALMVGFRSNFTFSNAVVLPKLQNEYAQGAAGNHVLSETQSWGPKMQGQEYVNFLNQKATLNTKTENPFEQFTQTGTNLSNSLSINKGLDKGSIYLSATNLRSRGIYPKEEFNNLNLNFRVNYEFNKYFSIDTKVNVINQTANNRPNLLDSPDNPTYSLLHIPRSVYLNQLETYRTVNNEPVIYNQLYDTNADGGIITRAGNEIKYGQAPLIQNPFWTGNLNTNKDNRKRMIAHSKLDINLLEMLPTKPFDKLTLMLRAGVDYYNDNRRAQVYNKTLFKPSGTATLDEFKGDFIETNYDFLLSGLDRFGDLGVSASLGGNIRNNKSRNTTVAASSIINPYGNYVIQNFLAVNPTEGITDHEIQSIYAMATLDYKSMLYLDASIRNDWSSTLAPQNRSFLYPSVSMSWIISETFKMPQAINYLKLRASLAEVGNDLKPGQIYYTYTTNPNQYFGLPYGAIPSNKPNFNILPEKTKSQEYGIESRFFDSRLNVEVSYYRTGTKNQIFSAPVAPSSGFERALINAGYIANKGVELSLKGDVVRTKDLTVGLIFNASRNYANVEEMAEGVDILTVGGYGGVGIQVRKDYAPGLIVGTAYQRDANGNIMLDEKNLPMKKTKESGSIDNEVILGNCMPKWLGGFGTSVNYKGIIGDVFFDGKFGHQMYSYTNAYGSKIGVLENTIDGRDAWQLAKDMASITGLNPKDISGKAIYGSKNGQLGTYYTDPQEYFARRLEINEADVYDASFIRLQRISVGYQFTKGFIKHLGLKALSVSAVASDLCYIMKHTPNVSPNSPFTSGTFGGVEMFAYPETRNFGFSIGLDF